MEQNWLTIEETEHGKVLTKCSPEATGEIIIPEGVTEIGAGAFELCSELNSVAIPNTVTTIGKYAFYTCSGLTAITIPNSVTEIKEGSFSHCKGLNSLIIPNSVAMIGNYAFSSCSGLTSVTIPACVTEIGEFAFEDCAELISVDVFSKLIGHYAFRRCDKLHNVILRKGVKEIGCNAFEECRNLFSIEFPHTVIKIGSEAFFDCALTQLNIPISVIEIGEKAFYGNGIDFITIPPHLIEKCSHLFNYSAKVVRINIPKNDFQLTEGLKDLLRWDKNNVNRGKLILTAPQLCKDKSSIPGYIKVTRTYDDIRYYTFEEAYDVIVDINTKYIMFIEPVKIERFEPCNGTIIHLASNGVEQYQEITVYEDVTLVAEKIKSSLSRLSQDVGGVAGLLQQLEVLCKPQPLIK